MPKAASPTDLLDEIAAHAARARGPACSISILRSQLDPPTVAQLDEAMGNPAFTAVAIATVLKQRGFPVALESLRRHRKRQCRCDL